MSDQKGKLVILLMILVGVAMAGFAWWHQREAGRRSAEFWGTESAVAVRYGTKVEFIPLRPKEPDSEPNAKTQTICGSEYQVGEPVNVARTRGLVHARHALVDDLSFDWSSEPTETPHWEFLLRFENSGQTVTAAFDTKQGLICFVDQSRTRRLVPKIATAFQQKAEEWKKIPSVPPVP